MKVSECSPGMGQPQAEHIVTYISNRMTTIILSGQTNWIIISKCVYPLHSIAIALSFLICCAISFFICSYMKWYQCMTNNESALWPPWWKFSIKPFLITFGGIDLLRKFGLVDDKLSPVLCLQDPHIAMFNAHVTQLFLCWYLI